MTRSLMSRLTLTASLVALTATPALAADGADRSAADEETAEESPRRPGAAGRAGTVAAAGPRMGAGKGAKAGAKKGAKAGARKGAKAGARKGAKAGPRAGQGPKAGPRAGQGPKAGPRAGQGPKAGPRAGQGPKAGPRAGQGPKAGPRAGQGPKAGPRTGPKAAPHSGPTSGPRAGQGPKAGPRAGQGPKAGPRAGHGPGPRGGPSVAGSGPRASTPGATGDKIRDGKRPGRQVRVEHPQFLPDGWTPKAHRYHLKGVPHISPEYWGSGVFFYNPPPSHHEVTYVERSVSGDTTRVKAPTRAVDRAGSFAVGLKGGVLVEQESLAAASPERMSSLSGDPGYGITARYRPVEALGLEASWMRHEDSAGALVRDPVSLSGQLFAFPWTRLSPYVSGGVTFDGPGSQAHSPDGERRFTPHAGLGLELALGRSVAIDVEARYLSQMQALSDDPMADGAMQATAGLMVHF